MSLLFEVACRLAMDSRYHPQSNVEYRFLVPKSGAERSFESDMTFFESCTELLEFESICRIDHNLFPQVFAILNASTRSTFGSLC